MPCLGLCASRDVLSSVSWDAFAKDALVEDDSIPTRLERAGTTRARLRKRHAVGETTRETRVKTVGSEAKTEAAMRAIEASMDGNLLFAELDEDAKARVADAMTPTWIDEGSVVVEQGCETCEYYYVIEIGEARVMKNAGGSEERSSLSDDSARDDSAPRRGSRGGRAMYDSATAREVATLGPGRGFGELALLYSCPRSATVVANTPMKLWTLHAGAFKAIKRSVATRNNSDMLDLLQRVELFNALSEHQLAAIVTAAKRETYEANDVVFHQGDAGNCFCIVERGETSVRVDGHEVAKLSRGDYFGERALINNEPRAATIVATTDVSCLVLNRKTFVSMLGSIEEARCFAGLAECPTLAPLSDTQLTDIASSMKMQTFVEGDVVFQEDTVGDAFYVIIDGTFSVTRASASEPLATLTRGQYFGELALLRKDKRAATVTCASARAKVAYMTKSSFEKKIGNLEVLRKTWQLDTLSKVPIFSKLSTNEIKALADDLTDVSFGADQVIIRQGDKGDAMYILESGEVEVVDEETLDDNKQPRLLCKLGPQSYFGELGLINSDTRAATVRVPNRATAFIITRRTFEQHLGKLTNILKRNAEEMYIKKGIAAHKRPVAAKLEDLKTVGFLGVGSFGRVTLVSHGGETYALKEIGKAQIVARGLVDHVWREKETMKECDSPFLVNLRQTYVCDASIFMLMDKVLGGELFTYVHSRRSPLPESHAKFYAACVVLAFEYLHDRQIIYRDLKPENVLISSNGYVKVADFSFAKKLAKGLKTFTLCGTPQYLAPEQIQQTGHNRAVDWWALGVFIYELVNGRPPFNQGDHYHMYNAINDVKFYFAAQNSPSLRAVVLGFLRHMPAGRLGMGKFGVRDVKRHEWFATDINWPALANQRARAPYVPALDSSADLRHFVDTGDDVPGHSTKWGPYASVGRFKDF